MLRHSRFGMVNELVPPRRQLTANTVPTAASPYPRQGLIHPPAPIDTRHPKLACNGLVG